MRQKNPKISILILHYKVPQLLIRCLESIYKYPPKESFEIIVINNDEDSIHDVLSKFPKIEIIQNKKNIGFGAGFNKGVENAKGEYLLFLNPDTQVLSDSIDQLFIYLKSHPKTGIASSLLVNTKGNVNPLCATQMLTPKRAFFIHSFLRRLFIRSRTVKNFLIPISGKEPVFADAVQTACFMMRKTIFEKIGKFDEKYFLFFEEYDLAQRLQKQKLISFIIPSSVVVHVGAQSMMQNKKTKKYFEESRRYYFKKYYGYLVSSILSLFLGVSFWSVSLIFILGLATFLAFYKLPSLMIFTPEQGVNYLLARDMVLSQKFIVSSLSVYMLTAIFKLFSFNPLVPGYFTAGAYVASVYILYIVAKTLYSRPVGVVACFLYTTFPLAVISSRAPFFLNPFLSLVYPLIFLLIGILVVKFSTNIRAVIIIGSVVIGVSIFNCIFLLKENYMVGKPNGVGVSYSTKMEVSNIIISAANGREYNLSGKDNRNVDNYRYLTWYLGNGASLTPQSLKFIISESRTGVSLDIRGEKK